MIDQSGRATGIPAHRKYDEVAKIIHMSSDACHQRAKLQHRVIINCRNKHNFINNFFSITSTLCLEILVKYYLGFWPIFYLMIINSRAHNKCYNANGLIPD